MYRFGSWSWARLPAAIKHKKDFGLAQLGHTNQTRCLAVTGRAMAGQGRAAQPGLASGHEIKHAPVHTTTQFRSTGQKKLL
jgi:hypothetical protein